jgi:hypothetical protein
MALRTFKGVERLGNARAKKIWNSGGRAEMWLGNMLGWAYFILRVDSLLQKCGHKLRASPFLKL